MSRYRRAKVEGDCYFFTVVTEQRQSILTDEIMRNDHSIKQGYNVFKKILVAVFFIHCATTNAQPANDNLIFNSSFSERATGWRLDPDTINNR